MSVGLEGICQKMADYLNRHGVPAVTAWPMAPRRELETAVAAVSLRGCRVEPSGLQNYLGDRLDQETGRWEERYGRKARITLGLDLYAPERGDGAALQAAFDALAEALLLGEPEGMTVEELSCGQTVRDKESRRLMRPAEVVCAAWLSAVNHADGEFTDFELRGVAEV